MGINLGIALGAATDSYRKSDKERRDREYEDWKRNLEKEAEGRKQAIRAAVKDEYGKVQDARELTSVEETNYGKDGASGGVLSAIANQSQVTPENRRAIEAGITAEKVVRTSPYTEDQANQAIARRVMAIDPDAGFDYRAKANTAKLTGLQIDDASMKLSNNKAFKKANEQFIEQTQTINGFVQKNDANGLVAAATKAGVPYAKVVNGNEIEYYDPLSKDRKTLTVGEAGDLLLNAAYKQLQPTLMRFAPDAETQMKILQGFNSMQQKEREEFRAQEAFKIEKEIKEYSLARDKELDPLKKDLMSAEIESKKYDLDIRKETDPVKLSILKVEKEAKDLEVKFFKETDKDKKDKLKAEISKLKADADEARSKAGWYKEGRPGSGKSGNKGLTVQGPDGTLIDRDAGVVYTPQYSTNGDVIGYKQVPLSGSGSAIPGKDSKSDGGANKGVPLPMKNGKVDAAQLKDKEVYNTDKGPVKWNAKTQKFEQ
jgi:hypothetical protein